MTQQTLKNKNLRPQVKVKKQVKEPVRFSCILFLIAYGYVTVLTPNWMTFDSNGPKFMTLSFLNLLTLIFLLFNNQFRFHPKIKSEFFINIAGFAYLMLMIVSLLSFFKAWNVNESILHFAKVFTTFSAAYLVSVLLIAEKRGWVYLAVSLSLLLIFDSLTVFSDISKFIQGKIPSIVNIKSVYSNKNILGASILVKLPFALWLFIFRKGWLRNLGAIAAFLSMPAIFFISARAFYIGLFTTSGLLACYFLLRYLNTRDKIHLNLLAAYALIFGASIVIFDFTQEYLYPKNKDGLAQGIVTRLSTIELESGGGRFGGWKRSWHLIKKEPILGVGLGNWKVETLKEENLTNPDFTLQYKAHNDFIETTTETGIIGGLLYLGIFIFIGLEFLKKLLKGASDDVLSFYFLPATGMVCFFFDAFFNFPQDRPEISALMAIIIGTGIAGNYYGSNLFEGKEKEKLTVYWIFPARFINFIVPDSGSDASGQSNRTLFISKFLQYLFLALLIGSSYILKWNFDSLRLQRIIKQESLTGKYTTPSGTVLNGFPPIPDINVVGEPIAVQKARYLIYENKNRETIDILKNDKSSPWDARGEFFMSLAYLNLKKYDSALIYNEKIYTLKPRYFQNIGNWCNTLVVMGRTSEAVNVAEKYLIGVKDNTEAWRIAAALSEKTGNTQHALATLDSALRYLPGDTALTKYRNYLVLKMKSSAHQKEFDAANKSKNDNQAIEILTKILMEDHTSSPAYNYRAFAYYRMKEYQKSINDIDSSFKYGPEDGALLNLYGVNLIYLNRKDEACIYFKKALSSGNKDGIENSRKFCR
jgi:putative inorganic carbon (hco3(-)) transporter